MNRSLGVELVKKASQETGPRVKGVSVNTSRKEFQTERKAQRKAKRRDFTGTTNKLVWLELKIHKGKKCVKTEEWIRARLQRNLKTTPRSLNLTLHVTRRVPELFMLWCEKVSVKMCKILFTHGISGAQIVQVKHISGRNGIQSPGAKAYYWGRREVSSNAQIITLNQVK